MDSTPRVRAPELPEALDWIHTDGARGTLAELRGRVVLLDFWTYGCINCIHLVPELRALHERIPPELLVIVGVHSGKHPAERVTSRIRDASLRLGATHPIVNDRQFRAWRAFAVNAWPTLALIDPEGYVVASRGGERTASALARAVARVLQTHDARGTLATSPLPEWARGVPDRPAIAPGTLRYPTKISIAETPNGPPRVAIADAGHDRVLVGTLASFDRIVIERVIDGLRGPQGVAFDAGARTLVVADAGRHRVIAVDLATGAERTLAGTGVRVRTADDRRAGAIASPWDVAVVGRRAIVAMAGTHQLWSVSLDGGDATPIAGGRGEALVDESGLDALLAQPMGVAGSLGGDAVWFADAESSSVRRFDLATGAVRTLVGTGLFDFGDRDGVGDAARLQHAQAVAEHASGRLVVADSYNDALKWLDPTTRRVETIVRDLHEPAGVALLGDRAYVADTNAHRVVVVDLTSLRVGDVSVET